MRYLAKVKKFSVTMLKWLFWWNNAFETHCWEKMRNLILSKFSKYEFLRPTCLHLRQSEPTFFLKNEWFFDFPLKNLKVGEYKENTSFLDFFSSFWAVLERKIFCQFSLIYSSEKIHVPSAYVKNFRCHKIIFGSPRPRAPFA